VSTCISQHGEFSSHETDDEFTCRLCFAFDDTAAIEAVRELTEAIRLTVEYVGTETLPPKPGWSWFDALAKYAPETATSFWHGPRSRGCDERADAHPTTTEPEGGER
jgi:hypothetical protein